jgi:lipoprotein-anchoring transpeptidase ErfK/SrfK
MTNPQDRTTRPSGIRRGVWRRSLPHLAVGVLVAASLIIATGVSAATAADRAPALRPLVVLLHSHTARVRPDAGSQRIETVASRRPLTKVRTVLPVLGNAMHGAWLRVRLPGRPNSHTGWISSVHTRATSTEWSLQVDLSSRRVLVYQQGTEVRRFPAVVGKASTPTPRGRFFVEEAMALGPAAAGGPFALATSARSNVLQEFDGGPGQIALHGRDHLSGALGTASSHGCVRLSTAAIDWLARRIGAGTPLVIRR